MKKKSLKNNLIVLLGITIATCSFSATDLPKGSVVYAQDQVLTLDTCKTLAIRTSSKYDSALDAVESKKAKYESAVKGLKLKEKSLTTFRWSPLLSLKFPEKLTLEQASEFQFKPMSLQYDIDIAEHNVGDVKLTICNEINTLYVEIVTLQKMLDFNQERADNLEEAVKRNTAKLKVGQATQSDIDTMNSKLKAVNTTIASDRRTLEADLQKLSKKIGMDVTTGYTFESPYIESELTRDNLEALIDYALEHDQTYYEACIEEVRARVQLQTNYDLMKNHYGGDMKLISSYVDMAMSGQEVSKVGFKKDYKTFLEKIDSYWKGKKRICWFIKIPRLWLKGSIDGTRYIDDDPNILYQDVLDYVSAYKDKEAAAEELRQAVTDAFNNYISVKNSYEQYQTDVKDSKEHLEKSALLNRLGQLSYSEYDSEMTTYEDLQKSLLDTMKLYTNTLYSLDRTTSGGVDAILSGGDVDMQTAKPGESYIEEQTADGAYYYIKQIIQKLEFEVSIYIPEDFEVEITDYELWVNDVQIGDRTSKDGRIRHLALSLDNVDEVKLRLYNGDEFIDDCIIDPASVSGPLKIVTGYDIKTMELEEYGTYAVTINDETGLMDISITPASADIKYFVIKDEDGIALGGGEPISIESSLRHLTLVAYDLESLTIELMNEDQEVIYTGRFDTANQKVVKAIDQ
jgi:uncharacterized protein YlxW (UPF0749 family)